MRILFVTIMFLFSFSNTLFAMHSESHVVCSICLDPIKDHNAASITCGICYFAPCSTKHLFHTNCIENWLHHCAEVHEQALCPLCRAPNISAENAAFLNSVRSGNLDQIRATQEEADPAINDNVALLIAAHYGRLPAIRYLVEELELHANWTSLANVAIIRRHNDVAKYLLARQDPVPALKMALETKKNELIPYLIKQSTREQLAKTLRSLAHDGLVDSATRLCVESKTARNSASDALRSAVAEGQLPMVRFFIETQKISEHLDNLLELAVALGHVNIVNYLLDEQHVRTDGCVLLIQAANHGQLAVIEYLMQRREIVEILHDASHPQKMAINQAIAATLKKALQKGHNEIVYYFIRNHLGNIAEQITTIVKESNLDIIRYIAEEQLIDQDMIEHTAIQAIELKKNAIATYLLNRDARTAQRTFLRALSQKRDQTARYIVENNHEQLRLDECLFNAVECKRNSIVSTIAHHHNNLETLTKALALASTNGNLDTVKNLIEHYNVTTGIDEAICLADRNNHRNIVRYIVERRETTIDSLQEALAMATKNGRNGLAEILIERINNKGGLADLEKLITISLFTRHFDTTSWLMALYDRNGALFNQLIQKALDAENFEMIGRLIVRAREAAAARIPRQPAQQDPVNIQQLAIYAIRKGNLAGVRYFATHEAPHCEFNDLLRWAHRFGQQEIERYILNSHAARINQPDFESWKNALANAHA